jgi:hypothetical protein
VGNVDYGWGVNGLNNNTQPFGEPDFPIPEWHAPQPPMMRSVLDEAAQLNALLKQIQHLEDELVTHKESHSAVARFQPKSTAHSRAFANWERRSQYLLRELIKYQTYADCLQQAVLARHNDPSAADEENPQGDMAASIKGPFGVVATQTFLERMSSGEQSDMSANAHLVVSPILFRSRHRSTPSGITTSTIDADEDFALALK